MLVSAGCSNHRTTPSDPSNQDPGEKPGGSSGPGSEPDPVQQPLDISLSAPVTPVPLEAVDSIAFAVIRQGDLWLGSDNSRLWRQTNRGDIDQVVWAPDGHSLAFMTEASWSTDTRGYLYTLVPGEAPTLISEDISAFISWLNPRGFLWSPDSSLLAYGIKGGTEIAISGPGQTEKTFSLSTPLHNGPYWLSKERLLYSTDSGRPSVTIVDTKGTVINCLLDAGLPYPTNNGIIVVTGEYHPDEGMEDIYFTDFAITDDTGANPRQITHEYASARLLSWNPLEEKRTGAAKYFALSNADTLFLHQYAGFNQDHEKAITLFTQDIFLTYSEFSYPFWFAWAPDGNTLAALPFSFSKEGQYGEQAGTWDLVRISRTGNVEVLLEDIYRVKEDEDPIPFRCLPFNWAPDAGKISYLVEGSVGNDLWQLDLVKKKASLFLESCALLDYRP